LSIKSKPKLLFVIDSLTGGGAERVMANLSKVLIDDDFEITIVLTLGDHIAYKIDKNIKIVKINDLDMFYSSTDTKCKLVRFIDYVTLRYFKMFFNHIMVIRSVAGKFAQFVKNINPDCIISFLPNTNLIVLKAKKISGVFPPVICSDRNYLSREIKSLPYPYWYKIKILELYRLADMHVSVSKDAADDLHERFQVPIGLITTIYNGIDFKRIEAISHEEISPVVSETIRPDGALLIVAVGRLTKQKGHEYLLRALGNIKDRLSWRLLLLGCGEEEGNLKTLAHELGIADYIFFLGWQANPYSLMARCHLFVLSSLWEGFPNVLLEAMALGLPVIASKCQSGPDEILDDGKYGILVPPKDVHALENAIIYCGIDLAHRKLMAQKSLKRVQDYSLKKMAQQYKETIQSVMSC
jgi:glycosyltransferase involved in cell wall biosynthesis